MNNNIKAIFFDIDGTLVSFRTHCIPPDTVRTLDKLRQNGILLFIASGRHFISINNLGDQQFDGFVTINGGITLVDNQIIDRHSIDAEQIRKMNRYMREVRSMPCVYVLEDRLLMNYSNALAQQLFDLINFPVPPIGDLGSVEDEAVYQMIAFFAPHEEHEIMSMLDGCNAARWSPLFADVVPKGTSKVLGIEAIMRHFNLSRDNIMAFGDGGNDIEMLRYAHIGVAMGNAEQEVKAAADFVTTAVDDGGVAHAVEVLLNI